jgi:hypothetical protein
VTFLYRAYGLSISSDSFIPGLRAVEHPIYPSPPDIHLEIAEEPLWVRDVESLPATVLSTKPECPDSHDPSFTFSCFGDGNFFRLAYSDGARFVMDAAITRIWGTSGPSQSLDDLVAYLIGPIMGFVLRRRGTTALHASALSMEGKAIAFLGAHEAGKSTTAAALALRGIPVLCEDIVPLQETSSEFLVEPGHSRICLWPDSVNYLLGNSDALPHLTPTWEKCYLPLDGHRANLDTESRPLGALYLLAPREANAHAPRVEELSNREILLNLVQNTYMNWLLDRDQRAAEFEELSRLISHVPCRRIVAHSDPSQISALCDLILSDAERLLAGRMTASRAAGG